MFTFFRFINCNFKGIVLLVVWWIEKPNNKNVVVSLAKTVHDIIVYTRTYKCTNAQTYDVRTQV